jgi:hypothetical protein
MKDILVCTRCLIAVGRPRKTTPKGPADPWQDVRPGK